MTTHAERGIAIGILISEGRLHSYAGVPEMSVVFNRADIPLGHTLKAAFGGVVQGNVWTTKGRDCNRPFREVMKAAPECKFLRDLQEWKERHEKYFGKEKMVVSAWGRWVNHEGQET